MNTYYLQITEGLTWEKEQNCYAAQNMDLRLMRSHGTDFAQH